ncbi:9762_t:CDS:2 [Funneliformis mosseae]|uniref:9762_t:CDS:1 n=1 Tax=Funneliformis mosseae TaxID=27381 RepID=A0A9N9B6N1_FUNMO|nr:9762_t:CDS:2 [Funneliformis mosseae]
MNKLPQQQLARKREKSEVKNHPFLIGRAILVDSFQIIPESHLYNR